MAEYINRDAVHDLVRSLTKYAWASPVRNEQRVTVDADDVQFGVDKIPAADVAPVRHGRWIEKDKYSFGLSGVLGLHSSNHSQRPCRTGATSAIGIFSISSI